MMLIPVLSTVLPPLRVVIAAWSAPAAEEIAIPLDTVPAAGGTPRPAPRRINWPLILYLCGAGLLLARSLYGALRLRRIMAAASRERVSEAPALAAALGIGASAVELRSSAAVHVPFTAGVLRHVILLPADWREWPQAKLSSVLAHELAHVARRDWLAARLASLNRVIFWFHPLAWWLERKLASLAEESADQTALAVVGDTRSYAGAILDFALAMQGKRLRSMEATAMARSTRVGRRVERILSTRHSSAATLTSGAAIATVLCALPLVLAAAALKPEPQAPPPSAGVSAFSQAQSAAADEIARLEERLRANPFDIEARMKLLFTYSRENNAEAMARHAAFLVDNQPEESGAVIATQMLAGKANPGMADPQRSEQELQRLAAVWRRHASERSNQAIVLSNAAQVLQMARDHFGAEDYLQRARRLEPSNPRYLRQLAALYAVALLNPGAETFATRVKAELDTTPDAELLLAVAEALAPTPLGAPAYFKTPEQQRDYVESTKRRAAMAEKYLQRAQSLGAAGDRAGPLRQRIAAALASKPEVNPEAPRRIAVGGGVQDRMLVEKVEPVYPPQAKEARIQGTVRFTAVIDTGGHVRNLTLVSGHPLLVEAAQQAVQQWRYKPTLLNGEPVEVVTQIDVHFTLGGEPKPDNIAGAYRAGGEISAPSPIYKVEPEYSQEARDARLQGTVVLRAVIDADGRPGEIRVLRPLGMGLDEKAIEAVSQWRFRPGVKDGQPVPVQANIEINFRLGERSPGGGPPI
jgi:TonB family protein